jgi:hypothetical protein
MPTSDQNHVPRRVMTNRPPAGLTCSAMEGWRATVAECGPSHCPGQAGREYQCVRSLSIPLLDHELAEDELAWMNSVYEDFEKVRASFSGREQEFNPKEALREVLGREAHILPTPIILSGPGPWPNGRNRQGRRVAAVFLRNVEWYTHARSRTDQFPMYVIGEAEAFSASKDGRPVLVPVCAGDHFHNAPGAPHAFIPKVGTPVPKNWEIAFIAITPRNLREDTQAVSEEVRAVYKHLVGIEASLGV